MTRLTNLAAAALLAAALSGCATDRVADRCEAERRENLALATAAGTAVGAAAGAAVDSNDTRGAAVGAAAGALIGSQLGRNSSPECRAYYERRYGTGY